MHMGVGLVDFCGMGNLPEFMPLRNISISFLNFSFTLLFHFYCWFSYPFNWFISLFATHFPLEVLEWILLDVYSFKPLIIFTRKLRILMLYFTFSSILFHYLKSFEIFEKFYCLDFSCFLIFSVWFEYLLAWIYFQFWNGRFYYVVYSWQLSF